MTVETPRPGEWDNGWEEHRTRQLQRWAKWSMEEKLDWLEEAQEVVDALFEARRKLGLPVSTSREPDDA